MVRTLTVTLLLALGCTRAAKPLVEAPGARAVLAGADAAAALRWARQLGVAAPHGAELFAAGAPWAASVLPGGQLVVAVATEPQLALALGAELAGAPVLGEVRVLAGEGTSTLVRPERGRVLLAPGVSEARRTELAALLEVMALAEHPVVVSPPPPGTLRLRVADDLARLGVVDVRVERSPAGELVVHATASGASAELAAALVAPSPPWACALDEGALAVLAVPPLGAPTLDDAFDGPMLLALYPRGDEAPVADDPLPGASLVVAGVPRSPAAAEELRALLPASARDETSGTRRTLSAEAGRALRVVSDERLLAVGYGAGAPVARVGPEARCPPGVRPLLAGDLAALARALPGVLPREFALLEHAPVVARAVADGPMLSFELRASLPAGMPF